MQKRDDVSVKQEDRFSVREEAGRWILRPLLEFSIQETID